MLNPKTPPFDERSLYLRRLVVRALVNGGRGHVGPAMSLIEIMRVLYDDVLDVRPDDPTWADRDRCILSKGHGCLALYALLADKGFFAVDELDSFCATGSMLGGHPEHGKIPGVEASTGALGHGLSIGIGMALSGHIQKQAYRIFTLLSDGECNEGSVWEAAMFAAGQHLDNVLAIIDFNKWQATGRSCEVMALNPLKEKWESFGWSAYEIDGHNMSALVDVLNNFPDGSGRPVAVIAHTVKGKGVSFMEDDNNWHYRIPNEQEVINAKKELGLL